MRQEEIEKKLEEALNDGTTEAECIECGTTIHCLSYATTAWCEHCGKVVKIKSILIELGLI